ncbi:MAG: hypothetical protein ACPGC8_06815 [Flavobacteriaceae bacterium]
MIYRFSFVLATVLLVFPSCKSSRENKETPPTSIETEDLPYIITGYSHDTRLKEVSGIVKSLRFPGHFWVHNDSGDDPIIFRVNDSLEILQEVLVEGAQNIDWEDISIGEYEGEFTLFIGDIGDNLAARNTVVIYLVAEPESDTTNVRIERKIELGYEDGARDAELLLVDSNYNELVVATKRDIPSRVYSVSLETIGSVTSLTFEGKMQLPNKQSWEENDLYRITGGDSSSKGEIIIKNYQGVFYYTPASDRPFKDRLVNDIPTPLYYKPELQGEAIALDDNGYWVTSECADDGKKHIPQPLYFYPDFIEIIH